MKANLCNNNNRGITTFCEMMLCCFQRAFTNISPTSHSVFPAVCEGETTPLWLWLRKWNCLPQSTKLVIDGSTKICVFNFLWVFSLHCANYFSWRWKLIEHENMKYWCFHITVSGNRHFIENCGWIFFTKPKESGQCSWTEAWMKLRIIFPVCEMDFWCGWKLRSSTWVWKYVEEKL